MSKVLVFDPSGNFNEGSGVTGWALFVNRKLDDFGRVEAEHYSSTERYWQAVGSLIGRYQPDTVVCESYHLFGHKAMQQVGSAMETPQLIGYLRMICYNNMIDFMFQRPQDKIRVTDDQLVKMGILELKGNKHYCLGKPTVIHERDAIRHGIFYFRYGKGKK